MYPRNFTDLHIELTDKCQASCPMCARNINGGRARDFVGKNEITLEKFKQWFSRDLLKKLNNFYSCGNYGDPIIARDCLEIFQYVREMNPNCHLGIHTNGSARSREWWKRLAEVLHGSHTVTFGIDGFAENHVLYRKGTDWHKIIENARSFISAGGHAEIDCLVFKHNQHEIESFEKEMIKIGFLKINFKYTRRFYDMKNFPVENQEGKIEYYLEPAVNEQPINFLPLEKISKDISHWESFVERSIISPSCVSKKEIYIDARGNVFPCCWIGSDWIEEPIVENMPIQKLRNLLVKNTKNNFSKIGIINLNDHCLDDLKWDDFNNFIINEKPWSCVKNCNGR